MSDLNPWKTEPKLTAQHVQSITHEALTDWVIRAKLPYPVETEHGVLNLTQREMFLIQQAVRHTLITHSHEITEFLDRYTTRETL